MFEIDESSSRKSSNSYLCSSNHIILVSTFLRLVRPSMESTGASLEYLCNEVIHTNFFIPIK